MKYEFSAGGIVYKIGKGRTENQVEILVCRHSLHHGWVFPKGFIGDHIQGESKEQTALREVQEETGIIGKIIEPFSPVFYRYKMDGIERKKTVYYFLMEYIGGDTAKHDWEMENVQWLPVDEVEKRLTYESDKQAWNGARNRIPKMERSHSGLVRPLGKRV